MIPMASAITVATGSIDVVANSRGTTSFLIGSVPKARIALICSVTSMDPSSDAIPDPTRPAIINEVSTGPNSRTKETATSCPVKATAPKVVRVLDD